LYLHGVLHGVPPKWRHTCNVGQNVAGRAAGWSGPSRMYNHQGSYHGDSSSRRNCNRDYRLLIPLQRVLLHLLVNIIQCSCNLGGTVLLDTTHDGQSSHFMSAAAKKDGAETHISLRAVMYSNLQRLPPRTGALRLVSRERVIGTVPGALARGRVHASKPGVIMV